MLEIFNIRDIKIICAFCNIYHSERFVFQWRTNTQTKIHNSQRRADPRRRSENRSLQKIESISLVRQRGSDRAGSQAMHDYRLWQGINW